MPSFLALSPISSASHNTGSVDLLWHGCVVTVKGGGRRYDFETGSSSATLNYMCQRGVIPRMVREARSELGLVEPQNCGSNPASSRDSSRAVSSIQRIPL